MKILALLAALAATPALAAPTAVQPTNTAQPTRDMRAMALAAIDVPLSMELLARAGVDEAYATTVATDPAERRYVRVRATAAISGFNTPTAETVLERLAREDADPEVRLQATRSFARLLTATQPTRVAALLDAVTPSLPESARPALLRTRARIQLSPR